MASIAVPANFIGENNIPDKDLIAQNLQWFIDKYEPKLLEKLMSKDLYAAYLLSPTDARFTDLITPYLLPASVDYSYWFYLKDQGTQLLSTGAAQSKKKNAVSVSPYPKMVRAWNEMAEICRKFHKFMKDNATTYPEYKVCFPEWFYGWGFWDGVWMTWFFDWQDGYDWSRVPEIYRFKNTLGL